MAASPVYVTTPRIAQGDVTTANTNVDGTGTIATVITAAANGTRIDTLQVKGRVAAGTTQAADTVRIFLHDGANAKLFMDVAVAAGAGPIAAAVQNFQSTISMPPGFVLPNGWSIKAATHTGGATATYVVTAVGADF
jgi:hypothetical protein